MSEKTPAAPVRLASHALGEANDMRLALAVFREPFAWAAMLMGLAGAVLALVLLGGAIAWLMTHGSWWQPEWMARKSWLQWLYGGASTAAYVVAAWFLFPVTVTAVAGMFLEPLADRIERRYYPDLPPPRRVGIGEQIISSVRILGRGLGWNLLALPFYFIPVANVVVYVLLNAFLLSREYFQVVALRHLPMAATRACYRRHKWTLFRGGLLLTGLFVLPVVQVIAPLIATAWAVHRLWHRPDAILRLAVAADQPSSRTADT